ncbi:hypothetical protein [Streptomyces sp. NEAU-174]|uniref:hypothetical protein n=1 Tax=Streptomyces sp. NEAU-174 TaxID=3458254 RepID=UPI004044D07F
MGAAGGRGGGRRGPSVPEKRAAVLDERAQAARERERLQAELDKLSAGLARLRAEHAISPEDYGPGEYEAARDRIKKKQADTQAKLEQCVEVEQAPDRTDFEPMIISLAAEWETLEVDEQNALLKQLIRRVVLVRRDPEEVAEDGEASTVAVQIHPVWEADPWEDKKQVKA